MYDHRDFCYRMNRLQVHLLDSMKVMHDDTDDNEYYGVVDDRRNWIVMSGVKRNIHWEN